MERWHVGKGVKWEILETDLPFSQLPQLLPKVGDM